MCYCPREKRRLIKEIDQNYKNGERWALILNKSNRLEKVPEKSLESLTEKIIYKHE